MFFYVNAVPRIDVSELSSILYCSPIVVLLLGRVFLGEHLTIWDILASIFSLTGMTMITKPPFVMSLIYQQDNSTTDE